MFLKLTNLTLWGYGLQSPLKLKMITNLFSLFDPLTMVIKCVHLFILLIDKDLSEAKRSHLSCAELFECVFNLFGDLIKQ